MSLIMRIMMMIIVNKNDNFIRLVQIGHWFHLHSNSNHSLIPSANSRKHVPTREYEFSFFKSLHSTWSYLPTMQNWPISLFLKRGNTFAQGMQEDFQADYWIDRQTKGERRKRGGTKWFGHGLMMAWRRNRGLTPARRKSIFDSRLIWSEHL